MPKIHPKFTYVGRPCHLHIGTAVAQMAAFGRYSNTTEQESPKECSASSGSNNSLFANDVQMAIPVIHDRKRSVTDDENCDRRLECSLPNTYLESSIKVNPPGDSAEKNKSNQLLSKKRNNSSGGNHYEGNDVIKKSDIDHKVLSTGKSRRNIFKLKVPEKRLQQCGKGKSAGFNSCQKEWLLKNTFSGSSINEKSHGNEAENIKSNLLSNKENNTSDGNQYKGNDVIKKSNIDQKVLISGKSRRNLFKLKVPEKRLEECGKKISAGSISCQVELPLPITHSGSSMYVNKPGASSKKCNSGPLAPGNRSNFLIDNHFKRNKSRKRVFFGEEFHISPVPQSLFYANTLGESREISNNNLVLHRMRSNDLSANQFEGNDSIKRVYLGQDTLSSGKSQGPESSTNAHTLGNGHEINKNNLVLQRMRNNNLSSNHFEGNDSIKRVFLRQELHSYGISRTSVLKVEVPVNKPLKCVKCGKLFSRKWRWRFHVVNNCNPKLYKCDVCDKKYTFEKNLTSHRCAKTEEKPYKCDQCGYASNRKGNLKVHKNRHLRYDLYWKTRKLH